MYAGDRGHELSCVCVCVCVRVCARQFPETGNIHAIALRAVGAVPQGTLVCSHHMLMIA